MRRGPYELEEILGKGSMGTVYRGRHGATGQVVAVKVMATEMASDPVLLRRFEQECAAANRLRHPHLVRGLDFGVEAGQPYLVMELVEGQNLRQQVRQQGPLAETRAVALILQVADALQLAHDNKLIHRDVKPDNILVTADGQGKLLDLGLVKDLDAGQLLTLPRAGLGTIMFAAPEQFADARRVDPRCDVYGLAGTLYYALTGGVPFQARGDLSVLERKLRNDFVPPRTLVPSLSEHIQHAVCKALDAAPEHRPSSCRDFAALLTGAPVKREGASPPAPATEEPEVPVTEQAEERRVARRYPSYLGASCWTFQGGGQQWSAEVQDVSLTGMRLQLTRRFEPGTVLKVEVVDEKLTPLATLLVRVRWVRATAARRWSIGAAFHRGLSESELNVLLGDKPPTVVVERMD